VPKKVPFESPSTSKQSRDVSVLRVVPAEEYHIPLLRDRICLLKRDGFEFEKRLEL
jgi:hypothetical protein